MKIVLFTFLCSLMLLTAHAFDFANANGTSLDFSALQKLAETTYF